ncbi:hypothetical protein EBF03_02650 [Arcanobacterium haemolyticum]|uniref:pyrroline-5-carboxylate reductase family protein n=1 Tax=Arcanobacterium haemolyticum TaxID=28264 RepID=UPI00067492C1|nr:NAD(P)-binding domain-containing protein [Arcanobacterium haemolyticum]QCX46427.1 hypothetical protein EBF03_02650 [Arcanobacterium haemolyticum]SQH28988.1 Pyrroline-5-carboxylate reductase [Arcanobacterium haemolyticum]
MAAAIMHGLVAHAPGHDLLFSRRNQQAGKALVTELGATYVPDNREVAAHSHILIVAVKPHNVGQVLDEIRDVVDPTSVVVSIAAGVSLDTLASHLPASQAIRRSRDAPLRGPTHILMPLHARLWPKE